MKIVGNVSWAGENSRKRRRWKEGERERGSIELAWNHEVSYCSEESMDSAYSSCV